MASLLQSPISKRSDSRIIPYENVSELKKDIQIISSIIEARVPNQSETRRFLDDIIPSVLGIIDVWNRIVIDPTKKLNSDTIITDPYMSLFLPLLIRISFFVTRLSSEQKYMIEQINTDYVDHVTKKKINIKLVDYIQEVIIPISTISKRTNIKYTRQSKLVWVVILKFTVLYKTEIARGESLVTSTPSFIAEKPDEPQVQTQSSLLFIEPKKEPQTPELQTPKKKKKKSPPELKSFLQPDLLSFEIKTEPQVQTQPSLPFIEPKKEPQTPEPQAPKKKKKKSRRPVVSTPVMVKPELEPIPPIISEQINSNDSNIILTDEIRRNIDYQRLDEIENLRRKISDREPVDILDYVTIVQTAIETLNKIYHNLIGYISVHKDSSPEFIRAQIAGIADIIFEYIVDIKFLHSEYLEIDGDIDTQIKTILVNLSLETTNHKGQTIVITYDDIYEHLFIDEFFRPEFFNIDDSPDERLERIAKLLLTTFHEELVRLEKVEVVYETDPDDPEFETITTIYPNRPKQTEESIEQSEIDEYLFGSIEPPSVETMYPETPKQPTGLDDYLSWLTKTPDEPEFEPTKELVVPQQIGEDINLPASVEEPSPSTSSYDLSSIYDILVDPIQEMETLIDQEVKVLKDKPIPVVVSDSSVSETIEKMIKLEHTSPEKDKIRLFSIPTGESDIISTSPPDSPETEPEDIYEEDRDDEYEYEYEYEEEEYEDEEDEESDIEEEDIFVDTVDDTGAITLNAPSLYKVPTILKVLKVLPIGPGDIIKMSSPVDTLVNPDYTRLVADCETNRKRLDSVIKAISSQWKVKSEYLKESMFGSTYTGLVNDALNTMDVFTSISLSKFKIDKMTIMGRIIGFVYDNVHVFNQTVAQLSEDDVVRITQIVSDIVRNWMITRFIYLFTSTSTPRDPVKEKTFRMFAETYCKKCVFPLFMSSSVDIFTDFVSRLTDMETNGNEQDKRIATVLSVIMKDIGKFISGRTKSPVSMIHLWAVNDRLSDKFDGAIKDLFDSFIVNDNPSLSEIFKMFLYDKFCYPLVPDSGVPSIDYKILDKDEDLLLNQLLVFVPTVYNESESNALNSLYQTYVHSMFMKNTAPKTVTKPIRIEYNGETVSRDLTVKVDIKPDIDSRKKVVDKIYTIIIRWVFKSENGRTDVISTYKVSKVNSALHKFHIDVNEMFRFGAQRDVNALVPDNGVMWPVATIFALNKDGDEKFVRHVRCHPVIIVSKDPTVKEKRDIISPNCLNPVDSLPSVRELFERLSCVKTIPDFKARNNSNTLNKFAYDIGSDDPYFGYEGFIERVIRMMKYSVFRNNTQIVEVIRKEPCIVYQLAYCREILSSINYSKLNINIKTNIQRECDRMQFMTYVSEKYDLSYIEKMISDLSTYCALISDTRAVQYRTNLQPVSIDPNDKIFNGVFKGRFKDQHVPILTDLRTDYMFRNPQWRSCNRQNGVHLPSMPVSIDRHNTEHDRLEREMFVNTLYVSAVSRIYQNSFHPQIRSSEVVKTPGPLNEKYTDYGPVMSLYPKKQTICYYNIISNIRGDTIKNKAALFEILDKKIQELRLLAIRVDYKGDRQKAILNSRNIVTQKSYIGLIERLRCAVASYNYALYTNVDDIKLIPPSVPDMIRSLGGEQLVDKCVLTALTVPELNIQNYPTRTTSITNPEENASSNLISGRNTLDCKAFYKQTQFQSNFIKNFMDALQKMYDITFTIGQSIDIQDAVVHSHEYDKRDDIVLDPELERVILKINSLKYNTDKLVGKKDRHIDQIAAKRLVNQAIALGEEIERIRVERNEKYGLSKAKADEYTIDTTSVVTSSPDLLSFDTDSSVLSTPPKSSVTIDLSPESISYDTYMTPSVSKTEKLANSIVNDTIIDIEDEYYTSEPSLQPTESLDVIPPQKDQSIVSNEITGLSDQLSRLSKQIENLTEAVSKTNISSPQQVIIQQQQYVPPPPSIPKNIMNSNIVSPPPPPPLPSSLSTGPTGRKTPSPVKDKPSLGGVAEELFQTRVGKPHLEVYTGIYTEITNNPDLYEDANLQQVFLDNRTYLEGVIATKENMEEDEKIDLKEMNNNDFLTKLMTNRYYLTLISNPSYENLMILNSMKDVMFGHEGRMSLAQFDQTYKKAVNVDTDKPFNILRQRDYTRKLNLLVRLIEEQLTQGKDIQYTGDISSVEDIKTQLKTGRPSTLKLLDELIAKNFDVNSFDELLRQEKTKPATPAKKYTILTKAYSMSTWFNLTQSEQNGYLEELSKNNVSVPSDSFYSFRNANDYITYLKQEGKFDRDVYRQQKDKTVDLSKI